MGVPAIIALLGKTGVTGKPFDIGIHALPTGLVAEVMGLSVGDFARSLSGMHRYLNHLDQARARLLRALPALRLSAAVRKLEGVRFGDVMIGGYGPHPAIKAPIAV